MLFPPNQPNSSASPLRNNFANRTSQALRPNTFVSALLLGFCQAFFIIGSPDLSIWVSICVTRHAVKSCQEDLAPLLTDHLSVRPIDAAWERPPRRAAGGAACGHGAAVGEVIFIGNFMEFLGIELI